LEFFYCALNGLDSCAAKVLAIPAVETDPYDGTSPHAEVLEQRALALYRTAEGDARILLTSLPALVARTIAPERLKSSSITLRPDDEMPPELIVDLLIASGYVRQEPVGAVGEFSLRGGILDVFSPAHDAPHRVEFFGDTVDSIREFDADTQRSVGRIKESVIVPMRELSVRREEFMSWAEAAREQWTDDRFRRDLRVRLAHAERGESFPGWEYLLPLTRPFEASVFDYLKDAVFVIDEPVDIEKRAADLYSYLSDRYSQADDAGELVLAPDRLFLTSEELRARFEDCARLDLRLLGRSAASVDDQFRIDADSGRLFLFTVTEQTPDISIISQSPRRYHGRVQDLARDLQQDAQYLRRTALFAMPSLGIAERVREILAEYGITAELLASLNRTAREGAQPLATNRIVTVGRLSNGFTLPGAGLSVLVESDVFGDIEREAGQRAVSRRARKQRKASAFLSDLGDLKTGDYVVHVDHGIGQFQGLKQIATSGGPTGNVAAGLERGESGVREFMLLTYAEGAKLYVPVERLDLVQRYSAGEGMRPQLDRLGGLGWQKTKARVKRAMRDMAEELLKLYAERKLVTGHAYGEDTPWQQEFEDAFDYQLTPDQETAIEDVKEDMVEPQPMDRLIVGDVGYGKTEVAMRAAFKAVMEGKQVAVLAPTTVLVFQHYKTFEKRFSAFPVRVEMLSRFRAAKEQKEIVKALEAGAIDIVIGTHRLLSKDIHFKDLGLLVVDEEQRFGV
ncbi:MAG TPA: DEAD/DEAH box helicase, partial [Blastocatellia bacterium]|nr:DEAD/DEAH box helicase [Blastocatellia bacterium]